MIISDMNQPPHSPSLFHGRHFAPAIIILCVRWHLTYKLSYRDLVEMMAERGVDVSHTTILRWVQRFVPEFEKRWNRYARPVGLVRAWLNYPLPVVPPLGSRLHASYAALGYFFISAERL